MKSVLAMVAAVTAAVAFGQSGEVQAQRQARSVHLQHQGYADPAKVFYLEATADRFWPGSYLCLLGFDGGYAGVQELVDGRHIAIFSVWEPSNPFDFKAHPDAVHEDKRTKVLYGGPGVEVGRFGGEGTGGKSMTLWPWKLGQPIPIAVSCAPDGPFRTAYTCWLWDEAKADWFRMATFSTLVGGDQATLRGPYSFLEDFHRNVKSKAQAAVYTMDANIALKDADMPEGSIEQQFDAIEIPLLFRYRLNDNRVRFSVVGGFGASFMVRNETRLTYDGITESMGETDGIRKFNISTNLGLGMEYPITKAISFKVEPGFKYYLQSLSKNSDIDFKPYTFTFSTGIGINF